MTDLEIYKRLREQNGDTAQLVVAVEVARQIKLQRLENGYR